MGSQRTFQRVFSSTSQNYSPINQPETPICIAPHKSDTQPKTLASPNFDPQKSQSNLIATFKNEGMEALKGVGDVGLGIVKTFFLYAPQRITATSNYFGEEISEPRFFGQLYQPNDSALQVAQRISLYPFRVLGGILDTANALVFGTIDTITPHSLYRINQSIGVDFFPYTSPPPSNTREVFRDGVGGGLALVGAASALGAFRGSGIPVVRGTVEVAKGKEVPVLNEPTTPAWLDRPLKPENDNAYASTPANDIAYASTPANDNAVSSVVPGSAPSYPTTSGTPSGYSSGASTPAPSVTPAASVCQGAAMFYGMDGSAALQSQPVQGTVNLPAPKPLPPPQTSLPPAIFRTASLDRSFLYSKAEPRSSNLSARDSLHLPEIPLSVSLWNFQEQRLKTQAELALEEEQRAPHLPSIPANSTVASAGSKLNDQNQLGETRSTDDDQSPLPGGAYRSASRQISVVAEAPETIEVREKPRWKRWQKDSHEILLNGKFIPFNLRGKIILGIIYLENRRYLFDGKRLVLLPKRLSHPQVVETPEGYFGISIFGDYTPASGVRLKKDSRQLSDYGPPATHWIILSVDVKNPEDMNDGLFAYNTVTQETGKPLFDNSQSQNVYTKDLRYLENNLFVDLREKLTFIPQGAPDNFPNIQRVIKLQSNRQVFYYYVEEPYFGVSSAGNITRFKEIPSADLMKANDMIFIPRDYFSGFHRVARTLSNHKITTLGDREDSPYLSRLSPESRVIVVQPIRQMPTRRISAYDDSIMTYDPFMTYGDAYMMRPQTYRYLEDLNLVWTQEGGYVSKDGKLLKIEELPTDSLVGERWRDVRSGELIEIREINSKPMMTQAEPRTPLKKLEENKFYPNDLLGREIRLIINGKASIYRVVGIDLLGKQLFVDDGYSSRQVNIESVKIDPNKSSLYENSQ